MLPSSPAAAPCHIHFHFFMLPSGGRKSPMVVTSPVAGVISSTEVAHAGMPRMVPALVRIPRRNLYLRSPSVSSSPNSVTSPVPGTTRTTLRL